MRCMSELYCFMHVLMDFIMLTHVQVPRGSRPLPLRQHARRLRRQHLKRPDTQIPSRSTKARAGGRVKQHLRLCVLLLQLRVPDDLRALFVRFRNYV